MLHSVPQSPDSSWESVVSQVDALLNELENLAQTDAEPHSFFSRLLERAVFLTGAASGAVWMCGPNGRLLAVTNLVDKSAADSQSPHALELRRWLDRQVPTPVAEFVTVAARQSPGATLATCPIMAAGKTWGLLSLSPSQPVATASRAGYLDLLQAVAAIAGDYLQQRSMRQQAQQQAIWDRQRAFALVAHRRLPLRDVAYDVANDGRVCLESDRVSIAICQGRRCRLLAVSGASTLHRRSNHVRALERLTSLAVRTKEPLFYQGQLPEGPALLQEALNTYLDESATKMLMIVPFIESARLDEERARPFAAMIVEEMRARPWDEWLQRIEPMSAHAALALERAWKLDTIPGLRTVLALAPLWRWFCWRHFPQWGTLLLVVAAVCAGLTGIHREHYVTVRGELQPVNQVYVFAPADGTIQSLQVQHGQSVAEGGPLATIRSPSLELEFERVWGDIQTARQEATAVRADRLLAESTGETSMSRLSQLTARESATQERIENLEKQLVILEDQRKQLQLNSPFAGTVLTWDLEQQLTARPVRRGQALLRIADLDGPWVLRLKVPDRRLGSIGDQLIDREVRYILATAPETTLVTRSTNVSRVSQVDAAGSSITLEAAVLPGQVNDPRPGAEVVGKLHGGRRSLGFIWFHEFYEELRRRFF